MQSMLPWGLQLGSDGIRWIPIYAEHVALVWSDVGSWKWGLQLGSDGICWISIYVEHVAPGPPTQYYLGYAYARSLPLKAPPYLRTDKISEPPFLGLFAGFSCLGDPPKSRTLLNVPPYISFYNPRLKFLRRPKRERKTTPFLKKSPGEKSNTPLFYNSRAGLCRTKSTPLPEILGTRMRSLRPRSGGGGAGMLPWSGVMWAVGNGACS